MKKIAIFGGTFNPVHNEHIEVAKSAVKELGLDQLYIMPTYISPHKTDTPASTEDRLNMLKLAFEGVDKVVVSDFEIQKQGTSYTYQTVEHFKNEENAVLYFIVGGDMLKDFKNWRYPERILSACTLCAFDRENSNVDFDFEKEYFAKTFGKTFVTLNYKGKDLSSTLVRVYNSFGLDIKTMTDKKVADYITERNLYCGDKYAEFIKKSLPEKRLIHTANVVALALDNAKKNGLDKERVRISATLHDCAKYIDHKSVEDFVLLDGVPQPVIHAFLGKFVAQKYLGVTDQDILNAICYHTSGRPNMSDLEKLIFVADMLERGRNYQGVEKLREFLNGDLDTCFKECLKEEMMHLINKKEYIYSLTIDAYDYYIDKN